jgi:hypothetical protein
VNNARSALGAAGAGDVTRPRVLIDFADWCGAGVFRGVSAEQYFLGGLAQGHSDLCNLPHGPLSNRQDQEHSVVIAQHARVSIEPEHPRRSGRCHRPRRRSPALVMRSRRLSAGLTGVGVGLQ